MSEGEAKPAKRWTVEKWGECVGCSRDITSQGPAHVSDDGGRRLCMKCLIDGSMAVLDRIKPGRRRPLR